MGRVRLYIFGYFFYQLPPFFRLFLCLTGASRQQTSFEYKRDDDVNGPAQPPLSISVHELAHCGAAWCVRVARSGSVATVGGSPDIKLGNSARAALNGPESLPPA